MKLTPIVLAVGPVKAVQELNKPISAEHHLRIEITSVALFFPPGDMEPKFLNLNRQQQINDEMSLVVIDFLPDLVL